MCLTRVPLPLLERADEGAQSLAAMGDGVLLLCISDGYGYV